MTTKSGKKTRRQEEADLKVHKAMVRKEMDRYEREVAQIGKYSRDFSLIS